jgi:hypothetical protein
VYGYLLCYLAVECHAEKVPGVQVVRRRVPIRIETGTDFVCLRKRRGGRTSVASPLFDDCTSPAVAAVLYTSCGKTGFCPYYAEGQRAAGRAAECKNPSEPRLETATDVVATGPTVMIGLCLEELLLSGPFLNL